MEDETDDLWNSQSFEKRVLKHPKICIFPLSQSVVNLSHDGGGKVEGDNGRSNHSAGDVGEGQQINSPMFRGKEGAPPEGEQHAGIEENATRSHKGQEDSEWNCECGHT